MRIPCTLTLYDGTIREFTSKRSCAKFITEYLKSIGKLDLDNKGTNIENILQDIEPPHYEGFNIIYHK